MATWPSAAGNTKGKRSPPRRTPPAKRARVVAWKEWDRMYDCVAWAADTWAEMSTCCPIPERFRSRSASRAPHAASDEACNHAWGTHTRTGGRSSSPVKASEPLAASTTRSVAAQPSLGPPRPNGVIETVTKAGLLCRRAARSSGSAPAFNQHVGLIGQKFEVDRVQGHGPFAPVIGQVPQRMLGARHVADEGSDPADTTSLRGLDRDDLGAKRGQNETGQRAPLVSEIKNPERRKHNPSPHPARLTPQRCRVA